MLPPGWAVSADHAVRRYTPSPDVCRNALPSSGLASSRHRRGYFGRFEPQPALLATTLCSAEHPISLPHAARARRVSQVVSLQ